MRTFVFVFLMVLGGALSACGDDDYNTDLGQVGKDLSVQLDLTGTD
jgi:hypothetical protein